MRPSSPIIIISIIDERHQSTALRLDSGLSNESISERIPPHGTILCKTSEINLRPGRYSVMIRFDTEGVNRDHMDLAEQFEVVMEAGQLGFRTLPDKDFSSHLVRCAFKNEQG